MLKVCRDCGREYDISVETKDNGERCDLCADARKEWLERLYINVGHALPKYEELHPTMVEYMNSIRDSEGYEVDNDYARTMDILNKTNPSNEEKLIALDGFDGIHFSWVDDLEDSLIELCGKEYYDLYRVFHPEYKDNKLSRLERYLNWLQKE